MDGIALPFACCGLHSQEQAFRRGRCLQPCSLFNSEPLSHSPVQVDELKSAAKASAAKLKRASDFIMRLEAEVGAIPSTAPAHVKTAAVLSASIACACYT